jgi:very-short-patch-repair endonuclease
MVWNYLKKKQLRGYDFDRQRPIDNFIVDFYCKDLFLAIEIDGESHYGNPGRDKKKDKRLKELGVTVLRFDDMEVRHQLDNVLEKIEKWIDENAK